MSEPYDPARGAAKLLASAPLRVSPPSPQSRALAIEVAGRAITQRRLRRRRRAYLGVFAAAAALVLVAAGALSLRRAQQHAATAPPHAQVRSVVGDVRVQHEGRDLPLSSDALLVTGDRVVAPAAGHAELTLPSGTRVGLESTGALGLVSFDAQQVLSLGAGSAHFEVAKLGPGERFLVRTGDVEVEVRGTVFDVGIVREGWSCPEGVRTQVNVAEGVVVVRHAGIEHRLVAGDAWPQGCGELPPPVVVPVSPSASVAPSATTAITTSITTAAPPKPPPPPSSLEAQNDLLAKGLAAKRAGDRAGALAIYETFLARYPGSGLAEVAAVERMRLLSGPSAVAAAKAYLVRYPSGFAQAEARKIAGAEK